MDSPPRPAPPSYPGHCYPASVSMSGGRVVVPLGSPEPPHLVAFAPSGDPVTHFNLDQLLEIVQSFRLDTTHAQGQCTPYRKVGWIARNIDTAATQYYIIR